MNCWAKHIADLDFVYLLYFLWHGSRQLLALQCMPTNIQTFFVFIVLGYCYLLCIIAYRYCLSSKMNWSDAVNVIEFDFGRDLAVFFGCSMGITIMLNWQNRYFCYDKLFSHQTAVLINQNISVCGYKVDHKLLTVRVLSCFYYQILLLLLIL